ncbi:uncharacterized protein LOC126901432 [Daktulosphaira vitifoliae]|uniref:uncharacterized protein LOC126901432 n=1 Tax=Daktulosphaira vitifoliae TaxID=58002 RepID=UPI0021A9D9EB|nr:uncharacterized protein LOC126901432 [Daktulosphaira vitifoliae]
MHPSSMKYLAGFACCIAFCLHLAIAQQQAQDSNGSISPEQNLADALNSNNESKYNMKKIMWKRCISKNYVTCVKLALVHLVDRLENTNGTYSLMPGITVTNSNLSEIKDSTAPYLTTGRELSDNLDGYLANKINNYFNSLMLNIKLLDDETARNLQKFSDVATDVSVQSGRGKKQKYAQSILLAGWVTGATLLVIGMKAIAVLAGKALMTALLSLLLSGLSSFKGGHSEPKSTTYEIVTKPVYSHSHTNDHDIHAAASQNNPTYRRSINNAQQPTTSEEADHIVYRIHTSDKTPIYIPIERRR